METRRQTEQYGYVTGPRNGSYYLRYWSAPDAGGKRHRRAVEVGTKGQFANIDAAKFSVEAAELRRKINAGILSCTVGQVIATFERDALPARLNSRATALSCLEHIKAQWSEMPIAELASPTHAQQLVGWLNGLRSRRGNGAAPLSIEAKMRVKAQMSSIFTFAMTQGYIFSGIHTSSTWRILGCRPRWYNGSCAIAATASQRAMAAESNWSVCAPLKM